MVRRLRGRIVRFFDKSTKVCMFVDLKVLNNSGYRGTAEKSRNKYRLVLIENTEVSIFLDIIRGIIHAIYCKTYIESLIDYYLSV